MKDIEKRKNNETESTKGFYYEKPDCDIYETDNEYKIYFDIPGVEKEDINLKVEKDILYLTAECVKKPVSGYQRLREEMSFNGYKRSFSLNNTIDTDKIDAVYENGTLMLTLYKKEEKKTKEIKINAA